MEKGEEERSGQLDEAAISEIVRCEKSMDNLLVKLIPHDRQENDDLRVISISDSEPMGKTALTRSAYGRIEVKRWFVYRAWICVQDNSSVKDVLASILRQISTSKLQDVDEDDEIELSRKLHEYFFKQRYLVVLDNTNSVDFTAKLLRFLHDSRNGSRVIITTRNVELPCLIDPWVDPIKFHPLNEEDIKQLLLPWLNESDSRLHHVQRILSRCGLPPGGIRLLGGLLSVTRESEQFEAIINRLGERENPCVEDILPLCYYDLSHWMQSCIMYVCQFPREYEIPTRRLLRLWLAESLVLASQRDIQDAEKCFQELAWRNMIHVVSRRKGNGSAKTCRMPGFIYDFLLLKALQTGFFEIYGNGSSVSIPTGLPKFVAPRIVVDKRTPRVRDRLEGSSETQYNVEQLRSYISFNTKKIKMPKRELDIVFNPKGDKSLLEVLDLEGIYKPILPKNLGEFLLNLKYLGLRWTSLHELPKSVGSLPCLETLDVKHTNIRKVPSSIWTKKSLRHLYLNEVSLDKSIPHRWSLSPCSKLPKVNNLQTLCGLRFKDNSPILYVLSKLTGITKLSLICPSTVVKEVMERIKGLTTLQSLKLKCKDLLGQPSDVLLADMNGLLSLSNLYLFGYLQGNSLSFLPKNLKSLTLSMSFLNQFDVLGTLENLTELRLYAFSYRGETLICSGGTFPQLRILKLWKLGNLKSLIVEKEAMPYLEELDIRDCQNLGEIRGLGERKTLKEVSLGKVSEELAVSLEASLGPSIVITTELIASAIAKEG